MISPKKPYDCGTDADSLVIVTEWEAFRSLDMRRIARLLNSRLVVDLSNNFRLKDMAESGLRDVNIGRPKTFI